MTSKTNSILVKHATIPIVHVFTSSFTPESHLLSHMLHRFQKHKEAITDALRASGRTVHHSVKCHPHAQSSNEFIPIETQIEPKNKMGVVVFIKRESDKPTLPKEMGRLALEAVNAVVEK